MQAAVEAKRGSNLKLLLVTVLTHLDDLDLQSIGYGGKTVRDVAKDRARRALRFNFDGVISSGYEAHDIKGIAKDMDFLVICPGIRPQGSARDDQKRVMTPSQAISHGADYLVVGRPIVHAENPRVAAGGIVQEMQSAFDSR